MTRQSQHKPMAKHLPSEKDLLDQIDTERLPRHIAIIMDGNGRWARKRRLPRTEGHRRGVNVAREMVKAANDIGVEVISLYAFSTENWVRPKSEVSFLMRLLNRFLSTELDQLVENNVRLRISGQPEGLPKSVQRSIRKAIAATVDNSGIILNMALNYSGRVEITDAIRKIAGAVQAGELDLGEITSELVAQHLYHPELPDPDLLIRTSGEFRVSNYMLWQIAYAEVWITDCLWPDFSRANLYQAILDYQQRNRRFGGIG